MNIPAFLQGKSLKEMEDISDFYIVELADMLEKPELIECKPLNHTQVSRNDFDAIASFGRIVKNYLKMKRIEERYIAG